MTEENEEEDEVKKFPESSVWNSRGKISFSIPENDRAKFFIKCYEIKLTPQRLFKMIYEKFMDDDPEVSKFIENYLSESKIKTRSYVAMKKKIGNAKYEIEENFSQDEEFLEKLYDFFETKEEG
jgi:hypothetical protein